MLNKSEVRIHKTEYLDEEGLQTLWEKIKEYVRENTTTINPDDVNIDLSNYITKEMLEEALNNVEVDLSSYITNTDLTTELLNYAKSNHTHTGYATESYVDSAIANAELGNGTGEIDLTSYLKKSEAESTYQPKGDYLTEHQDISNKSDVGHTHTVSDITDYEEPDLSGYAKSVDIPSLDGYATEDYVTEQISNISSTDLSDYYNKEEVNNALDTKSNTGHTHNASEITGLSGITNPDMSNYYTKSETYSKEEVNSVVENASIEGVDLSGYVSKDYFNSLCYYDTTSTGLGRYTLIDADMPRLPTFEGGTVFHVLPPTDFTNFFKEENENLGALVKRSTQAPLLMDDVVWNVSDDGKTFFETVTINNTQNGYLDDYLIMGVDYIPDNGVITLLKKNQGIIKCERITNDTSNDATIKYISYEVFASFGAEAKAFVFDTSKRTGNVIFDFGDNKCFTTPSNLKDPYGQPVTEKSSGSWTEDVTDLDYYTVIVEYKSEDGYPSYTIDYSDNNKGTCTFKIYTSNISETEFSEQYPIVLDNYTILNSRTYLRYSRENLYGIRATMDKSKYYTKKEIDELTMTESEVLDLLDSQGIASEEYVNNQISNIPPTDLSNYYTKEENYTKEEVNNIIPSLDGYLRYSVVTEVPTTQEEGVLYLVTE